MASPVSPHRRWRGELYAFCHLNKDTLLMQSSGGVFHLKKCEYTWRYSNQFCVYAELRDTGEHGFYVWLKLRKEKLRENPDGSLTSSCGEEWVNQPIIGLVVRFKSSHLLHLLYMEDWNTLQREEQQQLTKRASILKEVPARVATWCLGANALVNIHTLPEILDQKERFDKQGNVSGENTMEKLRKFATNTAGMSHSLQAQVTWWCNVEPTSPGSDDYDFAFGHLVHEGEQRFSSWVSGWIKQNMFTWD